MVAGIQSIGFIGIGRMGSPMARHLVKAGFDLHIDDLRSQLVDSFLSTHGGRRIDQDGPPTLDAIITMLPNGQAVRNALLGGAEGNGHISRLRPNGLVVDMSSSEPVATRKLGAILGQRNIGMMDAPVSGGVIFAENATLSVLAAGVPGHLERCRPVFAALASDVFYCGALGSGHALKALCNYVNAASFVTLLEALAAATKFGIKSETAVTALRAATTGRNHPLEKKVVSHVLTRRFATGMALGLIAKDIGIAHELATALSIETPILRACLDVWNHAAEKLGLDVDQAEIARIWENSSETALPPEARQPVPD